MGKTLNVKKGQKEMIKTHAERAGMSLQGFITAAIEEKIQREQRDV